MDRDQKLRIAKMAYREIEEAIKKYEDQQEVLIRAHWDECITVDDELFHGPELRERI